MTLNQHMEQWITGKNYVSIHKYRKEAVRWLDARNKELQERAEGSGRQVKQVYKICQLWYDDHFTDEQAIKLVDKVFLASAQGGE